MKAGYVNLRRIENMTPEDKENTGYLIKPIGVVRSGYRAPSLTLQDQDLKLDRVFPILWCYIGHIV